MKMGEVYQNSLKSNEVKVLRFIVDENSKVEIVQSVKSGIIQTTLSMNEKAENPIDMFEGTYSKIMQPGDI